MRGFTPALLHGNAASRGTGTGDDAEQPRAVRGLSQFLTIASYDPDTASDGTYRVNFNHPDAVFPRPSCPRRSRTSSPPSAPTMSHSPTQPTCSKPNFR